MSQSSNLSLCYMFTGMYGYFEYIFQTVLMIDSSVSLTFMKRRYIFDEFWIKGTPRITMVKLMYFPKFIG